MSTNEGSSTLPQQAESEFALLSEVLKNAQESLAQEHAQF